MSAIVWLFVGIAIGILFTAFIGGRSYRDELAMRDEWERTARRVLREIEATPHFPGWIRKSARELLADEAGT